MPDPADHSLDADFGAQPTPAPAAPGAPKPSAADDQDAVSFAAGGMPPPPVGKGQISAYNPKALGAKTLQSATLGFGADAARVLIGKQAEKSIRDLSNAYDQQHPLAAFGIDLAVAAVESAVPVLGEAKDASLVKTGVTMAAKRVATGSAVGAVAGVGAGGDAATRAKHGAEGAIEGGVLTLGLGAAGALLKPILDRLGPAGFSQAKAAADSIKRALASEGKSPADLVKYMRTNPNARLADFSPKVADLVVKASEVTNNTARQLGANLREDTEKQGSRLFNPSQPLLHVKQQLLDNVKTMQADMAKSYDKARFEETVPVTAEMQKIFDNPAVQPHLEEVAKEAQAARAAGRLNRLPPFKQGSEIPVYALDELQRKLGNAAEDAVGTGHAGTLRDLQQGLNSMSGNTAQRARALAAKIGGEQSETGVLGAQQWGSQFAFGLKSADIDQWRAMTPLQKEYARLGMTDGMERYLRDHSRMPAGALDKIADRMKDSQIREVLGDRTANQIKKTFATEATRARVNDQMARGGSRRAAFEEENTERIVGHGLNVVGGGAVGSWLRLAKAKGISEAQGRQIIDIATKPGGMQRLQAAGVDKNLLDRLTGLVKRRGFVPGAMTQMGRTQETGD